MNQEKVALISGVGGQDGSYMAEWLISRGYKVFGLTRDAELIKTQNIQHLGEQLVLKHSTYELDSIITILNDIQPDEIYNFAGQSFVSRSWSSVEETIHSQGVIVTRFLEAIVATNEQIKFINASSSEIFDPNSQSRLSEKSLVKPYNPYGCAKLLGHTMVDAYRIAKNIHAVNAILFPHESPRRNKNFAFKKIIDAAVKIKMGSNEKLILGSLEVKRDWGYAPSYVEAMHRLAFIEDPANICLCTGQTHSVQDIVEAAFSMLDLDWGAHVMSDPSLLRAYEPHSICGNPEAALEKIGWKSAIDFHLMVKLMIDFEMQSYHSNEKGYSSELPHFC